MIEKRGQIGTEYLIIVSFVVFAVLATLAIALVYSANIQDSIRLNQLEKAAKKIVFSAETTYYDGYGALATVEVYFPDGIEQFQILSDELVFNITTRSGTNVISYKSNVPLSTPSPITPPSGIRKVRVLANQNDAEITIL